MGLGSAADFSRLLKVRSGPPTGLLYCESDHSKTISKEILGVIPAGSL